MRHHTSLRDEIRNLIRCQERADGDGLSYFQRQKLEAQKWRLIQKYLSRRPFPTRERLSRSAQWREAADQVRPVGELELLDWVLLQVEVASNRERGIPDMRPRKNGPCHRLIMEYIGQRRRKALAVLKFARACEEDGFYTVDSRFHRRSCEIWREPLGDEGPGSGGHEGAPFPSPADD